MSSSRLMHAIGLLHRWRRRATLTPPAQRLYLTGDGQALVLPKHAAKTALIECSTPFRPEEALANLREEPPTPGEVIGRHKAVRKRAQELAMWSGALIGITLLSPLIGVPAGGAVGTTVASPSTRSWSTQVVHGRRAERRLARQLDQLSVSLGVQ